MFFTTWDNGSMSFHYLLERKKNPVSKTPELKPHQQLLAQEGKKKQI